MLDYHQLKLYGGEAIAGGETISDTIQHLCS